MANNKTRKIEKQKTYIPGFDHISRGGLLIEPGRLLNNGQQIDLNFAFVMVQAKVQWVSKKFAVVSIIDESANVDDLHSFIRSQFGVAFAWLFGFLEVRTNYFMPLHRKCTFTVVKSE